MALDGLVISNLVYEFNNKLINGRINKINQPESDEIILTIKNERRQFKLLLSANASYPLAYITNESKVNPLTAPNFCMLLRKHLNSARIVSITQPNFERIIDFKIEHLNEMGDLCYKHLIIELMGKHSNIIFIDENNTIIDSIKHISSLVSSVREVLPGRNYVMPPVGSKVNPLVTNFNEFKEHISFKNISISKAIYSSYIGISPLIANEICIRASIEPDAYVETTDNDVLYHLYNIFNNLVSDIKDNNYSPTIIYNENNEVLEFSSTKLSCYSSNVSSNHESISQVLFDYYFKKEQINRIKQKAYNIRRIINNALERTRKKYDLQLKQLQDTRKKDKYKLYGELLTTYGYNIENGAKSVILNNYYTNEDITIPLDENISSIENAKKYFEKYNKLKRTNSALSEQIVQTQNDLLYLESVSNSLDMSLYESDLSQIKEELISSGYIKNKQLDSKSKKKNKLQKNNNKPLHYLSSDGFHIYVGKNNLQNDELTFKFATNNDWWFHAKGIAGSHVIVKTNNEELPDRTFEEAGSLAAYYSKGRGQDKVEIDYIQKKHIKKPNNANPGFVIYHTNYSLIATPNIEKITAVN